MGTKTFRYENGDQKTEVKFNYSEDLTAQALLDWFERMAESAEHRIDLERAAKYDQLGVVKALHAAGIGAWTASAWWRWISTCRCSTASPRTKPTCTRRARGPRKSPRPFAIQAVNAPKP